MGRPPVIPETVVWWSRADADGPSADRVLPITAGTSVARNKPSGGLWTSPEVTEYGWQDWCRDNEMEWLGRPYRLQVVGSPRLLRVDSRADLLAAFERFPLVNRWHRDYCDYGLDWEKVAAEYDGFWLTAAGHFETRLTFGEIDTYSWDCETVLWFGWHFGAVEPIDLLLSGLRTG